MTKSNGFATYLLQNKQATQKFAGLDEDEKRQVLEAARNVYDPHDIHGIISDLEKLENEKSD